MKLKLDSFVDFWSLPKLVPALFCLESELSGFGSNKYGVDTSLNDFVVVDTNAEASVSGSKILAESFGNSIDMSSAK